MKCRHLVATLFLTGCLSPEFGPELGQTESAVTVGSIGATCSTSVVIGLSKQIADEVGCASPDSLVQFAPSAKLTITSNAVLPYLAKSARADLIAASNSGTLQVNSAFRTIAQQYLLYHWYTQGACGITAAARVGESNHESGRAVDLANYSTRISAMKTDGWAHDVPGDDVHFDHLASPDIRGRDTAAFQRLWNRNNPTDTIAEDGAYGPRTEARLIKSPAGGFAIGATCRGSTDGVELIGVTGPDKIAPGTQAHYSIAVKNTGSAALPATTQLVTSDGMASPLHDPSWISDTVAADLGASVAVGAVATIELDITAPMVTEETPIQQLFALAVGATTSGAIPLAVTVTLDGTGTSGDGSEGGDVTGGCNAGGGRAGWLGGLGVMLAMRRRRSRA